MRRFGATLILLSLVLAAIASLTTLIAKAEDATPRFVITPERVLHDREVSIQLLDLKPNQRVTVRATRGSFQSEIEFVADAKGKVDVGRSDAKPNEQVAPLRILWSMKRDPDAKVEEAAPRGVLDPFKVSLTALADGKELATGSFELVYLSPEVERIPVKDGRLRGVFFRPKSKGKYPGLMTLGGSEGGVFEWKAALLAAHGYAVFNLAYFKYEDLPEELIEIPLEYFDEGLTWLEKQECVATGRLAVMGSSRGGELALLLGSRFPKIKAVIAYVPSHVVTAAFTLEPKASWTYRGEPILGLAGDRRQVVEANPGTSTPHWRLVLQDQEAVKQAAIPVEKINGPVLLISGKCDHLCPSAEMSDEVIKRLRDHKHPHTVRHLSYDDAWHYIGIPNRPATVTRLPLAPELKFGDTSQANAFASWNSWGNLLVFLDVQLKLAYSEVIADPKFDVNVAKPAYTDKHPKVLLDEGHHNWHTAGGRYKPFVDLISNDGYRVTPNKEKFEKRTLEGFDILVIANAASAKGHDRNVIDPAFTRAECEAVSDWVRVGGSLLLVADHAPYGAAAEMLANRFGVDMSKGSTIDRANSAKPDNAGYLVFSRENMLLGGQSIINGRNEAENVNRVVSFTGQSLQGPWGSFVFLKLSDSAVDLYRPGSPEPVSAKGRAQGVAFLCGNGRVVVLGEAAMLSAQLHVDTADKEIEPHSPFGMNFPGTDNRQLALNLMHWLSGLTPVQPNPSPWQSEVYVMNIDGTGLRNLTNHPAVDGEPDFSPDGKRLVFDSTRNGNFDLFVINIDGSNLVQLTDSPAKEDHGAWSPDGKFIAYQHDAGDNTDVYLMNADGSQKTRLTTQNARDGWPGWSPDGKQIVFSSDRDGHREIYVMNRDGSEQRRLTHSDSNNTDPAWSPDGRWIAFNSERDGNSEIYIMRPDGTKQTRITQSPSFDQRPCWSPDSRRLAFGSEANGRLAVMVIGIDDPEAKELSPSGKQQVRPSWSPNGRLLLVQQLD